MYPLISIVLPTYNGSRYLAGAIDSCLEQTYANIELIIVDDASTDGTPAIIEYYAAKDRRVKPIRHYVNKKLPAALNTGFTAAAGEFFTWTSDDNIYKQNALEMMVRHLISDDDAGIVFSDIEFIDENDKHSRYYRCGPADELPILNRIGACFLYRRNVHFALGGYDEDKFLVEDWDFWMRAHIRYKFLHIPRSLYYYRAHKESLTSKRHADQLQKSIDLVKENNERNRDRIPETIRMRSCLKAMRYAKNLDNRELAWEFMQKALEISPDALNYTYQELIDYANNRKGNE